MAVSEQRQKAKPDVAYEVKYQRPEMLYIGQASMLIKSGGLLSFDGACTRSDSWINCPNSRTTGSCCTVG